jgi:Xaa-Pro dipeptidase
MRDQQVDLLLLTPGADMLYLTGFEHGHAYERLLAFVLRCDGTASWMCPSMNVPQVEAHALPGHPVRGWSDAETYLPPLKDALRDARTIAFDDDARSAFLLDLLALAPSASIRKASAIARKLRIRKDAAELAALRAAAKTVDETIAEAISFCVPGRTEADVDEQLHKALLRRSPESSVAFTIIASGPNGALPHHETARRKLEAGDVMILDYGTRLNGYLSDITVTCSVGEPRDLEARAVYRIVHEAVQAAIGAVRPGVACEAVDAAARAVIERAGYGPQFLHRTGHGLGLEVHEPPYIVAGSRAPFAVGTTFTVEPGIYVAGACGVRIEDDVVVAEGGVESLTSFERDLIIVKG